MYDILIRGGDLVDGTGSARRRADVGIQGDRVVAIGDLGEDAAETIDARRQGGRARASSTCTPTTTRRCSGTARSRRRRCTESPPSLAGNCGFTIAPLSDDAADGDYLMRMLARVEGMPLESLARACRGIGRARRSTSTRSKAGSVSTPVSWSVTRRSAAS